MPTRKSSTTGSELFIVDNSDEDWKVRQYLRDWCQLASGIDIATGYFEIGGFLALKDEWQKVDTHPLKPSEIIDYYKQHWPGGTASS